MLFFFLSLFPLFIKLSFSQPASFLAFALLFSPVPLDKGVRVSKQLCGCLPAGQGQPTTLSNDVLNNNFVFSSPLFGRECTWKGLDLISRLERQIIVSNRFYYRMYSIKIMWWGGLGQDLWIKWPLEVAFCVLTASGHMLPLKAWRHHKSKPSTSYARLPCPGWHWAPNSVIKMNPYERKNTIQDITSSVTAPSPPLPLSSSSQKAQWTG